VLFRSFLTDGVEAAVGAAGDGVKTVLHYADDLDNDQNKLFRQAFKAAFNAEADVYAVQGYDAMQILGVGLKAVKGDVSKRAELHAAMAKASFDSPRGPMQLSPSRNPVQNFYLRELSGGRNVGKGVAAQALADSGKGCKI
jgi:branched-chain amino acid transport system substrate-binding protein